VQVGFENEQNTAWVFLHRFASLLINEILSDDERGVCTYVSPSGYAPSVMHKNLLVDNRSSSVITLCDAELCWVMLCIVIKGKGSPYSRVPELIPVLGSQPAGDVSHKPGVRLPLLSARPAVTPATLSGLLPVFLLGEQRHNGCEQFA